MLGAAGLATLLFLASCGDNAPAPANEVHVREQGFQPNDISVRPGEKVSWVNIIESSDNIRTVTSGSPDDSASIALLFDEVLRGPESGEFFGERFEFRFDDPGDYRYFSRFPSSNQFTGIVRVR
jgi:plastocyanin